MRIIQTNGLEQESEKGAQIMLEIGKSYLFLTTVYHYIGTFIECAGGFYKLDNVDWIASTGKLSKALETGRVEESEHIGVFMLKYDAVIGIIEWNHAHPNNQP